MKNRNTENKRGIIIELLLAVLLLAGMTAFRMVSINGAAVSDGGFYELCKIRIGGGMPRLAYGMGDLYAKLLYVLFYLFGNQLAAAVYLQTALQLIALIFFYFAVRRLWGAVPALAAEAALFVFPEFLESLTVVNQTNLFLLVLCMYLFLAAMLFYGAARTKGGGLFALVCLINGLFAGVCVYLDLIFAVPFILSLLILLFLRRIKPVRGMRRRSLQLVCCLLGAAAGFGACVLVKCMNGMYYGKVLREYWQAQLTVDFLPVYGSSYPAAILLTVLFFIAAACFAGGSYRVRVEETPEKESIVVKDIESFEPEAAGARPACRYLENPLPLPRKHVAKEMNYGFEPEESSMKYDIEPAEDDDFDIA